jgi:hypothetical protein
MKRKRKIPAFAFGLLIFVFAAQATEADSQSNPYRAIVERNVFKLVPLPKPDETNAKTPPPEIVLNGIMTAFGEKIALFKARAGKEKNYTLAEGQRDGEMELLSVDAKAGTIKIENHGVIQTVALSKPPPLLTALVSAAPVTTAVAAADKNSQSISTGIFSLPENGFQNPAAAAAPQTVVAVVNGNFQTGSSANNAPPGNSNAGSENSGNSSGLNSDPVNGNFQTGSSINNALSGNNNAGSEDSGNSSGSNSDARPSEPWQVVAARNLEAARSATADLVSGGEDEPFPLTPLTPPGTPAYLIGNGQLYFVGVPD